MDHIFQQKLVRENQQLQLELAKVNKQIKQLQEKVFAYENLISETYMGKGLPIDPNEAKKQIDKTKQNITDIKLQPNPRPKIPTTIRMPKNPKLNKLEESHTLEQLKKLDKGKLNKLKIKYSKELSNIHSLLKKK